MIRNQSGECQIASLQPMTTMAGINQAILISPATADLDVEYNELILSWKAFQDNLAPHDQPDFFPHPQNIRDVIARVRSIQSTWIASPQKHFFSTAMKLCDRFLATMDSHSALLAILPDYECYASLFYGVLQSAFKVGNLTQAYRSLC